MCVLCGFDVVGEATIDAIPVVLILLFLNYDGYYFHCPPRKKCSTFLLVYKVAH